MREGSSARRHPHGADGRGFAGQSSARQAAAGQGEPPDPRDDRPQPDADPEAVARSICLSQLEHAPRTRAELAAVLARRGVPAEAAAAVLGRFAEVGLIDDALFARMWVDSRHRGRGLARAALRSELRRKGVDDADVAAAVEGLDPGTELETARAFVARRLPSTRGLQTQARVRRLAGMLARKGYPAGTAYRVVREALAEAGAHGEFPEPE